MKKSLTLGAALLLAGTSITPVAFADAVEENELIESEEGELEEEELDEEVEDLVLLDRLSLETALEFALEDNLSLSLLNYQLELIESQVGGATKNYRETAFDIRDLERTKKRLDKASGSFADRIQVQAQLEALDKQIQAVEDVLEQVKSGEVTLTYSAEEARESIKMGTIATYTQLLMAEQQQMLQEKVLETKEKEIAKMKRQLDIGVISYNDYATELREIERQKTQIEQVEKNRSENMAEFALDLGVIYHADLSLEALDLSDLALIEQEIETEVLIENSYKYKSQVEAIELAEVRRELVYNNDDSDQHDKNQADISVAIEKQNFEKLKVDGATSIRQMYYEVADGYQAILDAERELKFAEADYQTLERRYQLGIISRVDYELASIRVDQAVVTADLAKESYFLLTQKVNLLEAGIL